MFRANSPIIKSGRNTVRSLHLPVLVGNKKRFISLHNARFSAAAHSGRMLSNFSYSFSPRFHANKFYFFFIQKSIKKSDSVAASADTGNQIVRQASFSF